MATGSISDIPPAGPSVPSGTPLQDIIDLINASQAAYSSSLSAYNAAKGNYTAAKTAADAAYLAYQQDPAQLDPYILAVQQLEATKTPWTEAITDLHQKATTYVTHLAYEQIYHAQTSDTVLANALASILSEIPPSAEALGQYIPAMPWLTTAQIDALKAISETGAPDTQLKVVLQELLTAFLQYRNNQWQIAQYTDMVASLNSELELLVHQMHLAQAGVPGYDYTALSSSYATYLANRDAAQTQLSAVQADAIGIISALNTAISSYETTYLTVKNMGTPLPETDTTVQTIIAFCLNWNTTVVQAAKTAVAAELAQTMAEIAAANEAMIQNFNSDFAKLHPEISMEGMAQVMAQLAAIQSALTAQGVYLVASISNPLLLKPSSSMSMMRLMGIIGQAELMSQETIRLAADSENQVGAVRLQFAISHLMLYANELSALEAYTNMLIYAQKAFNESIEEENKLTYSVASSIYTTYRNNVALINDTIDQINTELEAENLRGQALVDAANLLDPAVIQAVFSEQISVPEAPNYLLQHLPATPTTPPTVTPLTFTPIPPFEHISIDDLPPPPYATLPNRDSVNQSLIDQFNQNIAAFLDKIAPFKDIVQMALETATGSTTPLAVSQVFLKSFLPVEELVDKRELFVSGFALLYSFMSQTVLSSISTESQESSTQALLDQLYQILGLFGSAGGSAGFIGVGGSMLAPTAEFNAALTHVVNSSIFLNTISQIVERAAIFAGLQVAGKLPDVLKELEEKNMTLEEYLELQREKSEEELDTQTRTELTAALIGQIVLAAGTPGALTPSVMNMLQAFPSLANLSTETLAQLMSGLVTVTQLILLTLTTVLGATMGLTPGQMATSIFGSAEASIADMVSRFMGLGIPQSRAVELASMLVGYDELEMVLIALGFDATTRTMLMAIIASSQGLIPLTDGAPGGPAFLDAILSDLKDRGITMTVDIFSSDFIKQLMTQLEIRANEEQRSILRSFLLKTPLPPTEGLVSTTTLVTDTESSLFQKITEALEAIQNKIKEIFAEPSPPKPTITPTVVTPVKPSAILSKFVQWYNPLAPDLKRELLAAAASQPELAGITAVSDTEKASLMLGIRLGLVTPAEAMALLMLVQREVQATAAKAELLLSEIETALIHRMTTPTEEEIRKREEARRREINRPYVAPSALPPQVLDQVSIAFRRFFNDLADANRAAKAFEAFAETIQRLSDFNKVTLDLLLAPAKIFVREFSLMTRTAQDRIPQSRITLSG